MRLDAITLEHFRNYAHQSVTFDPSVNVIVGENAQGKTNLLEAAVYLSCAKSPRARTEKEMISFDADAARLTGSVFFPAAATLPWRSSCPAASAGK